MPSPTGKWCKVPLLAIKTSRVTYSQEDVPDHWAQKFLPSDHSLVRLVIIRDSAHYVMLEQPEQFNKALWRFLEDLELP